VNTKLRTLFSEREMEFGTHCTIMLFSHVWNLKVQLELQYFNTDIYVGRDIAFDLIDI
jgi:hypothetical protein